MLPSRHGHFNPILILPVKMVVTTATCKYYCPLVISHTITNCCKVLHLKCGRVPRSVFETVAMHENYSSFVWKPIFFLIISKCCQLYQKSFCLSLYFLFYILYILLFCFSVWWSIFDQPFRRLLPLSCFYGSSQWLFQVKITFKRVNFIKKSKIRSDYVCLWWFLLSQFSALINLQPTCCYSVKATRHFVLRISLTDIF